jgi:Fe-S cluster assembly protein SufD
MTALDAARDHFVARFEAFRRRRGEEPAWLSELRDAAIDAFATRGLPSTRLEEWRYTNVSALAKTPFELDATHASVSREQLETLAFPLFACSLYVFVNGRFDAALSAPMALPAGSHLDSLASVCGAELAGPALHLGRDVDLKQHPFAALNTAFVEDGAVIRVPPAAQVEQPIHVVFLSTPASQPRVVHPRVLIVAEAGSRVSVIQDHVSLGGDVAFTNAVTEVRAGEDSHVDLVVIQREHQACLHVSNLQVRQQRDSRFSASTLTLGGALVRNDAEVLLGEEGAECNLHGLFVGAENQLIDNHTLIDHAVPRCTSRELYKGVLGGHARGVFRGRVIVRPDAQKTSAQQSNPNLLLSRGAEVDTKPQLEIYADDVKCSHGTSIGQLDMEALFYLRSRGLAEARARDLLTRAFALEILDSLPVAALGAGLDDLLLARLRVIRGAETTA